MDLTETLLSTVQLIISRTEINWKGGRVEFTQHRSDRQEPNVIQTNIVRHTVCCVLPCFSFIRTPYTVHCCPACLNTEHDMLKFTDSWQPLSLKLPSLTPQAVPKQLASLNAKPTLKKTAQIH